MPSLLLELFSEEIPARMQAKAEQHLVSALDKKLTDAGFNNCTTAAYSTPRRLAAIATDLPVAQPDVSKELKGPKTSAPEQALNGFLKKTGLTQDQLEDRNGVYFAKIEQKGLPTADVLKPAIEEVLRSFPWPKSMRWGSSDTAWVRPLHSILCVFDGAVVPVEFAGITASNTTRGHRFHAPDDITITDPATYVQTLRSAHVMVDRNERKALIQQKAAELAAKQNLALKDDAGLLEEVTGLVEWPILLAGKIADEFMDLPPEVLVSEMRNHQKYFAVHNADGSLANTFVITANIETADEGKAIIAGNERVLSARLADGRFFWDQDNKQKLADMAAGLAAVTYHAKLGSIADKVERTKKLACELAVKTNISTQQVERAAALCKADLVSGMVDEFPELQGIMGRYYANAQGEDEAVANAIAEHYLPVGPSSPVPTAPVSVCVALADKLDTLVSMFSIDEKPTGSKDPFALRRAALGVIRIILENDMRLSLRDCVNDELLAFFHDRLIVQLKDEGLRHDVIKAVVASGDDDLVRIVNRAKTVQDFAESDNGQNLLAGYKRAANILAIEGKKDGKSYDASTLDATALLAEEEIALNMALGHSRADILGLQKKEAFTEMMAELASLRTPIDKFFDNVMVNCDDAALRTQRLCLLARIKETMELVADFSQIEGETKENKKVA